MRIVLDIETNLFPDKIWCVVARDIDTNQVHIWQNFVGLQNFLDRAEQIIAHNGIFFDVPVLKNLWKITIAEEKIVDTLVMSRLYNPQLDGGHSLSEWGKRIGFFKSSFESFNGGLTQEMLDYCIQDTLVTQKLYEHLTKEMSNDYSKESIKLEHEVAFIRQQIAERLIEKGWKPKKRTPKGNIIVDETTLEGIDIPEAKAIAEYLMLQKRIAQVESWIDAIQTDGRVHGQVITNGAVTGRMTHHSPNMAQVPNSGSPYGPDCRELWTVKKGYKLVGIDASGLELRMLAHYMKDDAYTTEVVSGDIHTANQKAAGLETRNQAKTFIYAFLYGAGSAKIGSIVGGSSKEGQALITSFLRNTPRLKQLREKVSRIYAQKAWLPGLDGRKLLVRSEHSALNTLLQGAGAIAMKQALVIFNKRLRQSQIDYKFVANVHDEWQVEVEEKRADEVGKLGVQSIADAGVILNMRCPLSGEYRVGNNWKETH